MILTCDRCKVRLGEVVKGRIRKGTVHLCPKCGEVRLRAEQAMEVRRQPIGAVPDFLRGVGL